MKHTIKFFVFIFSLLLFLPGIFAFKTVLKSEKKATVLTCERRCGVCNGSGKCPSCLGTGKLRCKVCGGSGQVANFAGEAQDIINAATGTPSNQSAPSTITCSNCQGTGKLDCTWCNSSGLCLVCKGTGEVPGN